MAKPSRTDTGFRRSKTSQTRRRERRRRSIVRWLGVVGTVGTTIAAVGTPAYGANGIGGYIGTLAGTGTAGYSGSGGFGTGLELSGPSGVAVDSSGDEFIADTTNNRIEVVAAASGPLFGQSVAAGALYSLVGTGTAGSSSNGTAIASAKLSAPKSVAVDASGDLFIANTGTSCIQAVSPVAGTVLFGVTLAVANAVYAIAGVCGTAGNGATGTTGTSADLSAPDSVAFDASGNLYIVDTTNNCVRAMATTPGTVLYGVTLSNAHSVYPIVGTCGQASANASSDGTADGSVHLRAPTSIDFDSSNKLYFDDSGNRCVRATSPVAHATILASTLTTANAAYTVWGKCGTTGNAGNGTALPGAQISATSWIALDPSSNLFVSDTANSCLRAASPTGSVFGISITANSAIWAAGACGTSGSTTSGSVSTSTDLAAPGGLAITSSGVYVADATNNEAFMLPVTSTTKFGQTMTADSIYDVAGNGTAGYVGSGPQAQNSRLSGPVGDATDASGNVYVADTANNRIEMIAASTCSASCPWGLTSTLAGTLYTIAGTGTAGASSNGTAAPAAKLSAPTSIAFDALGNLFIDNTGQSCVQAMTQTAGTVLFGVTLTSADALYDIAGTCGSTGDSASGSGLATAATLGTPDSIGFDSNGRLYIADTSNNCIKSESSTGPVTQFGVTLTSADHLYWTAGTCGSAGSGTSGGAITSVALRGPKSFDFDTSGDLLIDDTGNNCIRAASASTNSTIFGLSMANANALYTVAGSCSTTTGNATGGAGDRAGASFSSPYTIFLDSADTMFIVDSGNNCIRATSSTAATVVLGVTLTTANSLYTVAGTCASAGSTGDGGQAKSAKLSVPDGAALLAGNLVIADTSNNKVRIVSNAATPGAVLNITPTIVFPSFTLVGTNTSLTSYLTAHLVPDPHWSLSLSSTALTNGSSQTLTGAALTIQSVTWTCDVGVTCTTPTNSITYPLTVPTTATTIYADSTGAGVGTLGFVFGLTVPANVYSGTYSSTWTLTSQAGP